MPGRLGAPAAVTRAAPEEKPPGPLAEGDQQPAPRPASAQLPRPAPRPTLSPPRPAPATPTCASAGSPRDGSRSPRAAGGVSWRLRVPGRGQAEHAAEAGRLRLRPGLGSASSPWSPALAAPLPGSARRVLGSRASQRVATVPRSRGSVEKAWARKSWTRGSPRPFQASPARWPLQLRGERRRTSCSPELPWICSQALVFSGSSALRSSMEFCLAGLEDVGRKVTENVEEVPGMRQERNCSGKEELR
ncbi:potassium/sodium hyperpolarization-activated cyclic nucleotide-gated channel 2-like [Rattus norvegicus]|uniref:potassium/sodium hyperpolarization-activated cyclic nucleotide-gated channel 2-like n=1 Tax=Rattus norvegicus TaxID=10116 RepID=UPI001916E52C|nr:potassium/sodium hyperpolarization-activated cyclic nucleotide-gated channel 2-like [Rattus norvegicus]